MNLYGDALHNFTDGAIIAGSYLASIPLGIATTIAVILHEIPQEFGDFGVLLHGGFTKIRAIMMNFLSAITAIIGAIFVLAIGSQDSRLTIIIIPFTIGGFLYIAGSDLLPELRKEPGVWKTMIQFIAIILGIIVMRTLLLIE
ncbi:ZIP family metal transporter, partial [Candidatus Woesearchaeota archaeon]|nr:ZIP family metal transporter [Candidatus Woesearchaeota archaeon]